MTTRAESRAKAKTMPTARDIITDTITSTATAMRTSGRRTRTTTTTTTTTTTPIPTTSIIVAKALDNAPGQLLFSRIAAGQSIIFDQRATHCMGLSRKQYYTACHKLKRAGIITKKDGDYRLSSFGKLVLLTQNIIARALACKPGLDTLDIVVQSGAQAMPYDQLIDMLVQDATIKRMLLTPQTKAEAEAEAVTSASMFNE